MNCMRCGRETKGSDVFCPDCLASMENYPVKPGSAVHLPSRQSAVPAKKPRRQPRVMTQEDQIELQSRIIRWMILIILCLMLSLGVLTAFLIDARNKQSAAPVTGMNYTTIADTAPASSEAPTVGQ